MNKIVEFFKSLKPSVILGTLSSAFAYLFGRSKAVAENLKETLKANKKAREEEKKFEEKSIQVEEEVLKKKEELKEDKKEIEIEYQVEKGENIVVEEEDV